LVPDSLTGTWLVSVDTANLAPFEVILFKALDDSGSARLLGVSRIPDFASRMGLNVIRPGPLSVTLAQRNFAINGLALGDRQLTFFGAACGQDLCGAVVTDSLGQFVDVARASRDWDIAFTDRYSAPLAGITPVAMPSFVLRLDDASIEDTAAIRLASQLHLPVSLAIPTGLIGDRWHLDWSTIIAFARQQGGLPLVHSRTHAPAPSGLLGALNEFAEAKRDFEKRDLLPLVFVQPGEWQGAFQFDSLLKFDSPYGVMLQDLYLGVHGYVTPAFRPSPTTRAGLLGRTHWTLDRMTSTGVEQIVTAVRSKVGVGLWLWHSKMVDPSVLEYFLRRVASLRDSGVIDLLTPVGEMLARQPLPVWDGVVVSDAAPRRIQEFAAVAGAACPDSTLVAAWDLDLGPGCGLRLPVPLPETGWPVRAVVTWIGQTRLRMRLMAGPSSAGGGSVVSDSTRGALTRSFGYLTPSMSDRAVTIALENIGASTLHISEFHVGFF